MLKTVHQKDGLYGHRIQEGDLVIVYENKDAMKAVRVTAKGQVQNRFGVFKHSDWIGLPYGSKALASKGNGFLFLLAPTPELWTLVLPHRTQILYLADISLVVCWLELRPGQTVLESGTGSGSLTHSLARAVGPSGKVLTFEFHEGRAEAAREEFQKNGLDSFVIVTVRDIQNEGFPVELQGKADAVFLDLPGPWTAVASVSQSLRPNGNFCSFSPCMEQVQKTCESLQSHSFTDIRTFEILLRQYDVRHEYLETDLIGEAKQYWKRRRPNGESSEVTESLGKQEENTPFEKESTQSKDNSGEQNAENQNGRKRAKGAQEGAQVFGKPVSETKGHTGYLTFARKGA